MEILTLQQTIFKQSPQQSSELPDEAKLLIEADTVLKINSYTSESEHFKVFLSEPIQGKRTWYVFSLHSDIVVEPEEEIYMRVSQDTYFKQSIRQASELPNEAKYKVEAPSGYSLESYEPEPTAAQHVKFKLKRPIAGKITWFAFGPHVEIISKGLSERRLSSAEGSILRRLELQV